MMKDKDKVTTKWFFSEPGKFLRLFHIYVKGDGIILIPIVLIIIAIGFISWKFMLLMVGIYLTVRGLGEMIYWLLQQFGDKSYRPGDGGYKKLDNNAIYIIYQLASMRNMVVGLGIIFYVLLYLY